MRRYFLSSLLAHFRSGRALFFLTLMGVALGVASVLCVQILNRNALGAFRGSLEAVSGGADLSVMGVVSSFPEELFPRVLQDEGVAAAWPIYRVSAAVEGAEDLLLDLVGIDLAAPSPLPWRGEQWEAASFLGQQGWVAVTPELATEMEWDLGSQVVVSSGDRRARLVIGATADFRQVNPLASRRLAVLDISQAQALLGNRGELHQIDVQVADGAAPELVAARLQRQLGPAVRVLPPEARVREAEGLLAAFRLNLTALSMISLLVGLFLVHSTTQASLVRRRAEFGTLRAIGASRRQVLGVILGETALQGILGALIGLPLGYLVARANVDLVSHTLSNIYLLEEMESLHLPLWIYVLAAGVGIGGAVAGALLPALDISRKHPRSLLAAYSLHERAETLAPRLCAGGAVVMGVSLVWFLTLAGDWRPAGFVLGISLLVALPLMTPQAVRLLCRRIRVNAFDWRYALKTLAVRLQTTWFPLAALGLSVSMLVGITVMIGSFRQTLQTWIEASIQADIYVSPVSLRHGGREATLSPALVERLLQVEGVLEMDRLRRLHVYAGEHRISLSGVRADLPGGESRFPLLAGDAPTALAAVREEGAILISEPLARKRGLAAGDSLTLSGPSGQERFSIAGVFYDYATEGGAAVMSLETLAARLGPGEINSIALYLKPGMSAETVADRMRATFADVPIRILSNRRLRRDILELFDQTFAITGILRWMSLLIAVSGITLTLLVLARQRVAELALYRALGADRLQIFRFFVGKGLGMGSLGILLGTAFGVALALILVFVINRAYFGWTIRLDWPLATLAWQAAVILTAAALASLYPARLASTTPATDLSREDVV